MNRRAERTRKLMDERRICVVVPTYNNASTLGAVLSRILTYTDAVIVVNDGSDDGTGDILNTFSGTVHVENHSTNKGKGAALMTGFGAARRMGYRYAITIDSDAQHFPEDIPAMVEFNCRFPTHIIVGQRDMNARNMPGKNTFANKFSNFWFYVQTGTRLGDTQTGFRLYPLSAIYWPKCITSRYEAELEVLVYARWHGIDVVPAPIRVYYAPQNQRISHFRPTLDFARISMLNTVLCFLTVVYAWPVRLWRVMFCRKGGYGTSLSVNHVV